MDKIGFIGLGRMGLSMAANIVKSGCDVWGFDTQNAQTEKFKERGGHLCASIAEVAAQSDIIITMLPNSEIVEMVIAGPRRGIIHSKGRYHYNGYEHGPS
jgi:3-hydroxyisobutyrate dehydrogenase-like beta-hydroxyacid dehydrogenase